MATKNQTTAYPWPGGAEWIETPLAASVLGRDSSGARFRLDTVLDGLSGAALTLRLTRPQEVGRQLFIVVWLGPAACRRSSGVALRGRIAQADERPGGAWRVMVPFARHRFIYTEERGPGTSIPPQR